MAAPAAANAAQIAYWTNEMGPTWATMQASLDRQLQPLGEAGIEALAPKKGWRVLDIGCGCGDTALELARRVGPAGAVVGVDVSPPMLEVARRRASEAGLGQARFIEADAQVQELPPVDAAFSRFGVMFFEEPATAFANIRRSLPSGGPLAFVCWRPLAENPWMSAPGAAAATVVSAPPAPPPPDAPGPFAFADPGKIERILAAAGFADVQVRPHDAAIGSGDLETSVKLALRLGPAAVIGRENPDRREAIAAAVRETLRPHVGPDGVRLPAAVWVVTARAP